MRPYFEPRAWPDMAQQTLLLGERVVDWRDAINANFIELFTEFAVRGRLTLSSQLAQPGALQVIDANFATLYRAAAIGGRQVVADAPTLAPDAQGNPTDHMVARINANFTALYAAIPGGNASVPVLNRRRFLALATAGAVALLSSQATRALSKTGCAKGSYYAEYYRGMNFETLATTRCEAAPLNKDWGTGRVRPLGRSDNVSARWTGDFDFDEAGEYEFSATADDGIRVYVDGVRIIDEWHDQGATTFRARRTLSAGTHQVRVEWYENGGHAVCKLDWVRVSTTPEPGGTGLRGAYIAAPYHTGLPFAKHGHWIMPWRGYMETKRADRFLDGLGAHISPNLLGPTFDKVCRHLVESGIKRVRFEMGWDSVAFNEGPISNPGWAGALATMKNYGIRPLVLANSNHGAPCPFIDFSRAASSGVSAGSRQITVSDVSGITPHLTGIRRGDRRPDVFVTSINGNTLSLSGPLSQGYSAGQSIPFTKLKYRPFGPEAQAHTQQTIAGWRAYLRRLGEFLTGALGTAGLSDVGFDLEIWNELTFGSDFVDINNYYDPDLYSWNGDNIWYPLGQASAAEVKANPSLFSGAELTFGFSNTVPWPSSVDLDDRYTGISKHPYTPTKNFPADEQGNPLTDRLDENLQLTTSVPGYRSRHADYYTTAEQAERSIWDMSPITLSLQGKPHGRFARGAGRPECPVWITEHNIDVAEYDITDVNYAYDLKARNILRSYCAFLLKGCKVMIIYHAWPADARDGLNWEIISPSFMDYIRANGTYPPAPDNYRSKVMMSIKRMKDLLSTGMDTGAFALRQLRVESVTDVHNAMQFAAVGGRPPLYDREVLFISPVQRAAKSWCIPFYVQTKDTLMAYTPKNYTFTISGFSTVSAANPATVSCLDPMTGAWVSVNTSYPAANTMRFVAPAADYPRLLSIVEP
jgi:hypothetical protein